MDSTFILVLAGLVSFVLAYYGAAVGLILGHLRLPLLVVALGSPVAGAAANLAISGLGALSGTFKHALERRVSGQALLVIGLPSAAGAYLGARWRGGVDPSLGRIAIGIVLLLTGLRMSLALKNTGALAYRVGRRLRLIGEAMVGLVLGALAGVVGLMMGSLRLPAMIKLLGIDPHVAVGTNMAIGCVTAFFGAAAAWTAGSAAFNPWVLATVAAPTLLGGYLGARLTGSVEKEALERIVGVTIALSGLAMLGQGLWPLVARP